MKKTKLRKTVAVQRVISGRGYAWLCKFGLCNWAAADRSTLRAGGKPTPDAKPVLVRLLLERDFRKLKSANAEVSDGGPLTHESPAAQSRRSLH